jgi:DNA repair exonuclease SbcCD ATPase subunit
MDPERRAMLVKRRAVIKGELTRTQTYIENHENKFHELKVRRDKLADIWSKYETVQQELECYDDADHSADREQFENQYYYVQAKFSELLQQLAHQGQGLTQTVKVNIIVQVVLTIHMLNFQQLHFQLFVERFVTGSIFVIHSRHLS